MEILLTILFFVIGLVIMVLFFNVLTDKKLLKGFEIKLFTITKYSILILIILILICKIWNIQ